MITSKPTNLVTLGSTAAWSPSRRAWKGFNNYARKSVTITLASDGQHVAISIAACLVHVQMDPGTVRDARYTIGFLRWEINGSLMPLGELA